MGCGKWNVWCPSGPGNPTITLLTTSTYTWTRGGRRGRWLGIGGAWCDVCQPTLRSSAFLLSCGVRVVTALRGRWCLAHEQKSPRLVCCFVGYCLVYLLTGSPCERKSCRSPSSRYISQSMRWHDEEIKAYKTKSQILITSQAQAVHPTFYAQMISCCYEVRKKNQGESHHQVPSAPASAPKSQFPDARSFQA